MLHHDGDRAYIAGFFDGEGCVYFRERGVGKPSLSITQKHRPTLEWIQGVTGVGHIYPQRDCWSYRISKRSEIRVFIRFIWPYSQQKKEQLRKAYNYNGYRWASKGIA